MFGVSMGNANIICMLFLRFIASYYQKFFKGWGKVNVGSPGESTPVNVVLARLVGFYGLVSCSEILIQGFYKVSKEQSLLFNMVRYWSHRCVWLSNKVISMMLQIYLSCVVNFGQILNLWEMQLGIFFLILCKIFRVY